MTAMTDRDVIAWARQYGAVAAMMGDSDGGKLRRLADLAEKGAEQAAEIERLRDALHRDQSGLAAALGKVVDEIGGRLWVEDSRGPYEWDDDRYKAEAGDALRTARDIARNALRESGTLSLKALLPAPPGGGR